MKKYALIVLISALPCMARVITFIPRNFEEFVSKMVPEKEQNLFKGYHTELKGKIAQSEQDSKRSTHHYIHSKALSALEEKHAVWAAEIQHFLTDLQFLDESYDQERAEVRDFLNWYGAYQEYEHAREQQVRRVAQAKQAESEKSGFITIAKTYVTKATQKVGGWFNGWRKNKTA